MPVATAGAVPLRRSKATAETPPDYETYHAPPPPKDGRLIGVDCHPDTFTAAVFTGQTVHDAQKLEVRHQLSLEAFLAWAKGAFGPKDLFLLEAGSNSFEIAFRLRALDRQVAVLESAFVGQHASTYRDNDKLAAARIALVYLGNQVPCVWVPDELTRQRRELLNAYTAAVSDHTAAGNQLKGYLNEQGIRLGKRNPHDPATRLWVEGRRAWSALQKPLLDEAFGELLESHARRDRLRRLVAEQVSQEPLMLRTMKLLGIATINAFASLAVIGDVRRFATPQKLAAYLGLSPGEKRSGQSKDIKIGIGRRGRGDLRHLLVQAAQSILRRGNASPLGQWGWKLLARKSHRNIAVGAVARKLAMQIWHVLKGNPPKLLEADKGLTVKLRKLVVVLGVKRCAELGLGQSLGAATAQLHRRLAAQPLHSEAPPEPTLEGAAEPV